MSKNNKRNIVVIGGSYVGTKVVETLAPLMHETHKVILVEKNSHFQHLFAFPRFAVVPEHTHKAFLPYTTMFDKLPSGSTALVRAKATQVQPDKVILDRADSIPYDYLVLATGTNLTPPGSLPSEDKPGGIADLDKHQKKVAQSKKIVIIGGGAVGVQLATDIKEFFPEKHVTLVHSRQQLMNRFHPRLNDIVIQRTAELDIDVIVGERVKIPSGGFPVDGSTFEVELAGGRRLESDFAIVCTGQTPLSGPLATLSPSSIAPSGFVKVQPTLQIADEAYPNVFALGDVADTGASKAARPAMGQAALVAGNIQRLVQGGELERYDPMLMGNGIHLTLGLRRSVKFLDPKAPGGEPVVLMADDGDIDVHCPKFWATRLPGVTDYYL